MNFRCPDCNHLVSHIPPTHKCPDCGHFSHDWLIDDWESFAAIKRRHIHYNLIIMGLVLINILATILYQSTNPFQWLINLIFLPAFISWILCRKQLSQKAHYKGHKGNIVFPWFAGFGGL